MIDDTTLRDNRALCSATAITALAMAKVIASLLQNLHAQLGDDDTADAWQEAFPEMVEEQRKVEIEKYESSLRKMGEGRARARA